MIMGCQYSQTEIKSRPTITEDVEVMADGSIPEPPPPAPTDPRLPLDARQVFKLKKSWKGIKRCLESTGVEMFIRMFRTSSDSKGIFKKFKDLKSDDELRVSETLEQHATAVMNIIDDAIMNIENVDYVFELLNSNGRRHSSYEGFSPPFFWFIEKPFLDAVKITLSDRYTDNMDGIYKITIKFILENLTKGAESANGIS
ncbi:Hypothetical predicted protein [Mytilus galloprovincialis]|uniref:Globin domain-containing protein n=1 Tax=Mytilus galloprovincialis TaxID=29158 RepID=A0A8B6H5Y7_MYTGA|nr:Hypothetical predicted protein [Mytilus galloprovincialis]